MTNVEFSNFFSSVHAAHGRSLRLDERTLLELDHDAAHAADVTRRSRRLGVELAQATHALPLVTWHGVVTQTNELLFALPETNPAQFPVLLQ